ncbi:MAG: glycosyltransferase [Bacteroidetes bacterium]|nr:glycosyltransferase [Bacteroidota bacterium]
MNHAYKVDFDIYGLQEEESYWQQCENAIHQLPTNITATYKGAIDNTQLKEALSQYHFSILPTMHENYGHSIVESWAAGCPVIISDNTPWRKLEKEKCGWDILLNNSNKFAEALNVATAMNQQTFNEWSTACVEKAKLVMQNNVAVDANRKLFAT